YQAWINGRKVSPLGINQPWSQYEKCLYYRDFDVTNLLRSGENCVGVGLANSFWNNPNAPPGRYNKDGPQRQATVPFALRAELTVTDEDGNTEFVGTDETWKWTPGPLVFSHIFAGEDFEPCLIPDGWDRPQFNDSEWKSAIEVQILTPKLLRQDWPAFAKICAFKPLTAQQVAPSTYLYRFPQNCSAQLKVRLKGGPAGSRVSFLCSEHAQSRVLGHYAVEARLAHGGGQLDYQWQSFYIGMQFVEVTGAVPKGSHNPLNLPTVEALELIHVRTNIKRTGEFKSSSTLYNQTLSIVNWAIESNMSHVFTDCPHREKLGWLECSYLMIPSMLPQYDCHSWLRKIQRDISDAQLENGRVLTVAPSYPAGRLSGGFDWTVEWGAAATMLPWLMYEWFGDLDNLRSAFGSMKRFVDHVSNEAGDGVAPGGLGDWYDYGHGHPPGQSRYTPPALSATAIWALCAQTVSKAAKALGDSSLETEYAELHREIGARFRLHFQDKNSKKLKHLGSPQCANSMAIVSGVVPDEDCGA
ncbi:MAG: alpha-L-rhamnosidase N-terminal domain-containing protein, partial [Fimbriimonadaceae bacterium]